MNYPHGTVVIHLLCPHAWPPKDIVTLKPSDFKSLEDFRDRVRDVVAIHRRYGNTVKAYQYHGENDIPVPYPLNFGD
jgi:hypothetical protein